MTKNDMAAMLHVLVCEHFDLKPMSHKVIVSTTGCYWYAQQRRGVCFWAVMKEPPTLQKFMYVKVGLFLLKKSVAIAGSAVALSLQGGGPPPPPRLLESVAEGINSCADLVDSLGEAAGLNVDTAANAGLRSAAWEGAKGTQAEFAIGMDSYLTGGVAAFELLPGLTRVWFQSGWGKQTVANQIEQHERNHPLAEARRDGVDIWSMATGATANYYLLKNDSTFAEGIWERGDQAELEDWC